MSNNRLRYKNLHLYSHIRIPKVIYGDVPQEHACIYYAVC
jgi:hypothetical protein